MDVRPLALIDVDGVLNPYGTPGCPPGYIEYELFPNEDPVRVHPGHGVLLLKVAEFADLTVRWLEWLIAESTSAAAASVDDPLTREQAGAPSPRGRPALPA